MSTVTIILVFLLLNVILAYVPIVLIVGYNLRPRPAKDETVDLAAISDYQLERLYITDEIPNEDYIQEVERRWKVRHHAPLT